MSSKILIVEDEPTLLEALRYSLENVGYAVVTAENGKDGLQLERQEKPEAVILDIMLPGMDGFEVCRRIRRDSSVPILMLTAKGEEIDKIVGLEVGADDYLTKPFSMRELMARVKALLRREQLLRQELAAENGDASEGQKGPRRAFGNLTIDERKREVSIDGEPVRLRPKEFDLLAFLARNRGVALSRSVLLERVWGWSFDGNSRTVDVHVRWLREKIEPDPGQARRIITVRGVGYRFDG